MIEEIKRQIDICEVQIQSEKMAGNQLKEEYWKGKSSGFKAALAIGQNIKKANDLMETFTECPDCGCELNIDKIDCCCEFCGIEATCDNCAESFSYSLTVGPKEE